MAYSIKQYTGDGTTTLFSVTFPFIARSHVAVMVDSTPVSFTWISDAQIQISPAPAVATVVDIRRSTGRTTRIVNYQDASVLNEALMDQDATQSFYVSQEALDTAENTIGLATDATFDALSKRIKNVADPVNAQDAVTKVWAETSADSSVAQAAVGAAAASTSAAGASSSASSASTSASTATTKAAEALASANAAAASAATATTKAGEAATSATGAAASAATATARANEVAFNTTAAAQSATDAAGSAATATTQAGIATTKAGEASTSATAAAASAALINDANLVHKTGAETIAGVKTFSSPIENLASAAPAWTTGMYSWMESGFGARHDGYQHRWDVGNIRTEAMRINSAGVVTLGGAVGAESLRVTPIASAVNRLEVAGSTTGTGIQLAAAGSDANIGINLTPKGAGVVNITSGSLYVTGAQVLGSRKTGWAAATGTPLRTTFATSSVTLPQLAGRVMALIDDLISHGAIGA